MQRPFSQGWGDGRQSFEQFNVYVHMLSSTAWRDSSRVAAPPTRHFSHLSPSTGASISLLVCVGSSDAQQRKCECVASGVRDDCGIQVIVERQLPGTPQRVGKNGGVKRAELPPNESSASCGMPDEYLLACQHTHNPRAILTEICSDDGTLKRCVSVCWSPGARAGGAPSEFEA